MLKLPSENLYLQLNEDLEIIEINEGDPLKRTISKIGRIRAALETLKQLVAKNSFTSFDEEIHFFKHVKPKFYSKLIYCVEQYKIHASKPCSVTETVKEYYLKELDFIERFFHKNQFLYEYYQKSMTELDAIYFVRGSEIQTVLFSEIPDLDSEFSTRADYLFSKFIAYELLRDYVLNQLNRLNPSAISVAQENKDLSELKWTGNKVNLVEVIYGIYFTGQLNHGNADLASIIKFMEKSLNIDLSRSYRNFIDIRNRKVSSPTRYLDEMRESIQKRVDDDLALKKLKRTGF